MSILGKERANFSAIVYLKLFGFFSEVFPLPLGAWDRLRYSIVALHLIILPDRFDTTLNRVKSK